MRRGAAGAFIVFTASHEEWKGFCNDTLWVMRSDGTGRRELDLPADCLTDPAWQPLPG